MKAAWIVASAMILNVAAWAVEYPGYIKVENFDAIAGGNVANLTGAAKYIANQPDSITFVDTFHYDRPGDGFNDFGSRVSGFLTPAESAEYVFFVASDDSTSLYLSTDSTPANLKLIAADQGWQSARAWTGPGGTSSGAGTTNVVFRRGFNPGPAVLEANGYQWVGPFQNRSDEFLNSPLANLATAAQRWPTTNAGGNAVINLVANQKYYFELLFKEGSGGDYTSVAWKKATDADPLNGDPEIPGTFLSVEWTNVLTFWRQPTNQTVLEGVTVNIVAEVLGIPGDSDPTLFNYQWYVNNVLDPAVTTATYTIPTATVGDNNKQFQLVVTSVTSLMATSAVATLTVSADNVPPRITRVRTSDTFASAKVTFSEPVRNEAVDPLNYIFTGGLTVSDANFAIVVDALTEDPKNPVNPVNREAVILYTSTQTEGAQYTLTINNVKDLIGNNLTPNTRTMYANVFQAGVLNYKRWMGGNNIPNLMNDPLRFANPTFVETRTVLETGGQAATYVPGVYVDRVDGFFIPTVTTNYVLYICADNDGYLYLSTDSSPANRRLIAADVGWQNTREWTGPGGDTAKRRGDGLGGGPFENRSDQILTSQRAINGTGLLAGLLPAPDGLDPDPWPTVDGNGNAVISLNAGTRYSIQLWHVEGDSGRAEATFKHGGAADPANGTGSAFTSGFIGAYVDPTSLLPVISVQPTNVMNFTIGGTITFNVTATSSLPITYQWYKDSVAIVGETNATLVINNATVDSMGSYYVAVSNENGPVNSTQVLALTAVTAPGLTFQEDGTGLTVIEAEHYFAATTAPDGHLWVPLRARAGYSGTGYMSVLPDSGINLGNTGFIQNGAKLDFRIAFVTTGTHYIWLRGGDPRGDGAGDSIHAGIDGVSPASATRIDGAPSFNVATGWNWVGNIQGDTRASVNVDTAGIHTVSLWMREDGFNADKILLTTDSAFTPTATGPAESALVASGPNLSISRNGANIVITYTGTLLSAPTVNGSYTTVAGASGGSYTVSPTNSQQYFRAQQ